MTFSPSEVGTYYAARVRHLKQRRSAHWRGAGPIRRRKSVGFRLETDPGALVLSLRALLLFPSVATQGSTIRKRVADGELRASRIRSRTIRISEADSQGCLDGRANLWVSAAPFAKTSGALR
jgi:hypothetical protein